MTALEQILDKALHISLYIHICLIAVCFWRVWKGENVIDRLMAFDLLTILTLAILVLTSLISQSVIYIDVALGLALLSFVATIALAKYVVDHQGILPD